MRYHGGSILACAATLGAGLIAALALRLLPTTNLRLTGLALVSVTLPLAAVSVSGTVMFSSGHDMTLLFVAATSSSAMTRSRTSRAPNTARGEGCSPITLYIKGCVNAGWSASL